MLLSWDKIPIFFNLSCSLLISLIDLRSPLCLQRGKKIRGVNLWWNNCWVFLPYCSYRPNLLKWNRNPSEIKRLNPASKAEPAFWCPLHSDRWRRVPGKMLCIGYFCIGNLGTAGLVFPIWALGMDLPSAQLESCWGWRVGAPAPSKGSLVLLQLGHPYLN